MSKWEWIWFWAIMAFGMWLIYQNSKKTPTDTFIYNEIEDLAWDELEGSF